jgi:YegS/Rv2252/BmrU family lipid kinase
MQRKPHRIHIILNPSAGAGNGLCSRPQIEQNLARLGLEFSLEVSAYPGHAIELARQAAGDGCEVVVAAGGDGTVNEVLNGLVQARSLGGRQAALGVVCVGRGNDFAGSLGIPPGIAEACQLLADDRRRCIDIGRVRGEELSEWRYFANCAGVGFDAATTIQVKKLPLWGGFLSFLIAVLKTVFLYNKAPLAEIRFDGQTLTQRSLLLSIMNGRRLGGGFYMAPDSQFDDGLFDLCIARQMSSWRILQMIPHFMKGTQATQPEIVSARAVAVHMQALDGPLPAQTDGEIISTRGRWLETELLPGYLDVITQA